MLIDIHSHVHADSSGTLAVPNVAVNTLYIPLPENSHWSAGFHPWYISSDTFEELWPVFMNLLNEKDCLMIGECGMDRLRGPDLAFQQMVFARQVNVAHKLNMPLIIHCVRAFNEVATVLKSTGIITPVIFHGYNNNLQIMRQILAGNIFFSLGRALLQEGSNAQKVALELPLEHLFLETDDADISIEILYAKLADLKKISFNDVEAAIFANYLRLKR